MSTRPQLNDKAIANAFYALFARTLIDNHPFFVRGMSKIRIVYALSLAGPPSKTSITFIKALEKSGWCEISDDVHATIIQAPQLLRQIHNQYVEAWLIKNKIKCPIKNAQPIKYGDSIGRGFITDYCKKSGQVLFRNDFWVSEHGPKGGVLVNWEDVICINDTR